MQDTGKVKRLTPEDIEDKHLVMMYSLYLNKLENSPATTEQACYQRQVENLLAPSWYLLNPSHVPKMSSVSQKQVE